MTKRNFGFSLACASAISFLLTLGALSASAEAFNPFLSTLTVPDEAISGFPAPFGTVLVDLTSPTTATITFTADESHANAYTFGSVNSAAVNLSSTSGFTISGLTGTPLNGSFTVGTLTSGGSGNVSSFGVFNETINDSGGFTTSAESITFTVTRTTGTWASSADVLTGNTDGFDAAAHIFICNAPVAGCTASSGATTTGFVAEIAGSGVTVPEPTSVFLLGSVLVGVTAILRKKAQRNPSN